MKSVCDVNNEVTSYLILCLYFLNTVSRQWPLATPETRHLPADSVNTLVVLGAVEVAEAACTNTAADTCSDVLGAWHPPGTHAPPLQ